MVQRHSFGTTFCGSSFPRRARPSERWPPTAPSTGSAAAAPTVRNPLFREQVMRAYDCRCALCGLQGRLGHAQVGLDAAHTKRHQAGEPDETMNGLTLCALHHKRLDWGVFTLTGSLKVDRPGLRARQRRRDL